MQARARWPGEGVDPARSPQGGVYARVPTSRVSSSLFAGSALGVALDVALALARDAQRVGRHVVGDHRAGAGVGAVADADWRHERRVDAHLDARADGGAVLVGTVVVGGDRAGAEVGACADVRVA